MWLLKNYEEAGSAIGRKFVDGGCLESINDISIKVAQDNNLTPDGIRTVVRIANTAAFTALFDKSASDNNDDRMIEFETGDPEVVITELQKGAQEKLAEITAPAQAEYDRLTDYLGDLGLSKVAADDSDCSCDPTHYTGVDKDVVVEGAEAPMADKHQVKELFRKAKKKMDDDSKQAAYRWNDNIQKVAQSLRVLCARSEQQEAFCKNAVASLGLGVVTELRGAHAALNVPMPHVIADMEKAAHVQEYYVAMPVANEQPLYNMLKEARAAREDMEACQRGVAYIEANVVC